MRTTPTLLFAALATTAVLAQNLPTCASNCLAGGPGFGSCNGLDVKCICSDSGLLSYLSCCVSTACDAADQAGTIKYASALCAGQGVTDLPTAATCSAGASGSASSATATSSLPASLSSALAAASTTASSTGSSAGTSASSSSGASAQSSASKAVSSATSAAAASATSSSGANAVGYGIRGMGLAAVLAGMVAAV
ncbi:hypothetical protein LTR62_005511 [Meristemomyces frigidus]|uniref:CFEM domain-containing protein n=1 Tax=Meristemomyces frigidus TaxID=1508187 RepID=A0AAN7TD26_9PEZI|nr:hypothetical protein LTR62_005511 [Meristemomyces frigidus]